MSPGIPPTFVTSNPGKFREAVEILGIPLKQASLDLPEIQELDVAAVARDKARKAFARLNTPILVEDTSLGFDALGGFPGPLVKWLLQAAGPASLCRLGAAGGDTRAVARCVALIWDGTREFLGEGTVFGRIVAEPRGDQGFGWDAVFSPEWGNGRTYAEMPAAEKNTRSHRTLALLNLKQQLLKDASGQS